MAIAPHKRVKIAITPDKRVLIGLKSKSLKLKMNLIELIFPQNHLIDLFHLHINRVLATRKVFP